MISELEQLLSVMVGIAMFIIIFYLLTILLCLDVFDIIPNFLIVIILIPLTILSLFIVCGSVVLVENIFRNPVDITIYNESGEYVCEYKNIKRADEIDDGLKFEYDGKQHVVHNYSFEFSKD